MTFMMLATTSAFSSSSNWWRTPEHRFVENGPIVHVRHLRLCPEKDFTKNDRVVYYGKETRRLYFHNRDGKKWSFPTRHNEEVTTIEADWENGRFATGHADGKVLVLENGQWEVYSSMIRSPVIGISMDSIGSLSVFREDGTVSRWEEGKMYQEEVFYRPLRRKPWKKNLSLVMTIDGIYLYHDTDSSCQNVFVSTMMGIDRPVAFDTYGNKMIVVSEDGVMVFKNIVDQNEEEVHGLCSKRVLDVAVDAEKLVLACEDGSLQIYDPCTLKKWCSTQSGLFHPHQFKDLCTNHKRIYVDGTARFGYRDWSFEVDEATMIRDLTGFLSSNT